jgi:uncharacterized protein (DUF58 family)
MIPESVMRELRYIEVSTARRMRALRVGPYTSRQRGQGFDFDELQPYRPGDDVRRIDWNVTARLDAPFVRHTHAERELSMMIAIDVSRSMDLGTSHYSKREAMMFVTASLLFSALASQINTGFLAFSDQVTVASPPRRARAAAWALLEECWAAPPGSGRTALVPMVQQLARTLKRMSIVFLVSDFLSDENLFDGPDLAVLAARHDVIAVVPEDPMEAELPVGPGYLRVSDLESRRRATVSLGARSRAQFAAEAHRRREALAAAFYRVPMEHVFVPTDRSPVEPLLSLFARSIRR